VPIFPTSYASGFRDGDAGQSTIFFTTLTSLSAKGLHRLDDMLRPARMSGMISDMLTASMAKHSRTLVENRHFNGHPDLIVRGRYSQNSVAAGEHGIEIKSTRKIGGAVDTHGARSQWMSVFVYMIDDTTEPAEERLVRAKDSKIPLLRPSQSPIFVAIRAVNSARARPLSTGPDFRSYVRTGFTAVNKGSFREVPPK
jgi:hypothetical protein